MTCCCHHSDSYVHLVAVVSQWLVTREPVDGANDPRSLVSNDWHGAFETTHTLVNQGYLKWADERAYTEALEGGSTYSYVVPTEEGLFEVLRP